jgi:glycosyltransferase involved in cell wall biosynthesis
MVTKVIVLANSAKLGGAEQIAKQCYVDIAKKIGSESSISVNLHRSDAVRFRLHTVLRLFDTLKSFVLLVNLLRKPGCYIIVSHMLQANIIARLLSVLFKNIKVYNYVHSNYELKSFILRKVLTDNLIEKYIFVSQSSFEVQKAYVDQEKIIVIENKIDTRRFYYDDVKRVTTRKLLGIEASEKVFIIAGRLEKEKKISEVIDLWITNEINHRLIIVGDGSLKKILKKQITRFNTSIHILDPVNNIEDYYNASDVLISNSTDESFGLVILESLNCGCKVFSALGPHTSIFKKYERFSVYKNKNMLLSLIVSLEDLSNQNLYRRREYSKSNIQSDATILQELKL